VARGSANQTRLMATPVDTTPVGALISDFLLDAEAGLARDPAGGTYTPASLRSVRRSLAQVEAAAGHLDAGALKVMDNAGFALLGRQVVHHAGLPASRLGSIVHALLVLSAYAAGRAPAGPQPTAPLAWDDPPQWRDPPRPAEPRRRADADPPPRAEPRRRADTDLPRRAEPRRRADTDPPRRAEPRRRADSNPPRRAEPRRRADSDPHWSADTDLRRWGDTDRRRWADTDPHRWTDPPRRAAEPRPEPDPAAAPEAPTPTFTMLALGAHVSTWIERIVVIAFVLTAIGLALELT
jgi:hypothetical protein